MFANYFGDKVRFSQEVCVNQDEIFIRFTDIDYWSF
jgi:hypothetical protein